nr:MAG TPA: hypothetical protein [Caudoviricetes sp.]
MIVTGNVQGIIKRIPIQKLKKGDVVIDLYHCPRKVESVTETTITASLQFNRNPNLSITEGTKVFTLYGEREARNGDSITVQMLNGTDYGETLKEKTCKKGYEVKVKGASYIYVNGYPIGVEKC